MQYQKILKEITNKNHLRNRENRINTANENHPVIAFLNKNSKKIKKGLVLEIGCSTGFVLEKIRTIFGSKCYGVDASKKAINEGKKIFRNVKLYNNLSENFIIKKKFDLIIIGFFLFMVPPFRIFDIFSNIQKHLKTNGHIIIYDFYNPNKFKKKKYKHSKFVFSHRYDFKKVFLSLPCYKLIAKKISYIKKMKDYAEVSLIKNIKI